MKTIYSFLLRDKEAVRSVLLYTLLFVMVTTTGMKMCW